MPQAKEAPRASAAASAVAGGTVARGCCRKHVNPCRHLPDLPPYDPLSGREDNKERVRRSRRDAVACADRVEDWKIDRCSACWCSHTDGHTETACCAATAPLLLLFLRSFKLRHVAILQLVLLCRQCSAYHNQWSAGHNSQLSTGCSTEHPHPWSNVGMNRDTIVTD